MVAKRSSRSERIHVINQARSLVQTGPDDLRTRFAQHTTAALVAGLASLRPRPGSIRWLCHPHRAAMRAGRSAEFLWGPAGPPRTEFIVPLVTAHAPCHGSWSLHGIGPDTAALLLIAAGDHPERLRSEATWAHLGAQAAPIPASSGKVTRHRLNPGGDRQANHALWRIVITRMSSHPPTRLYVERRSKEGLSKKEIIRCLKRYVAREVYPCLRGAAGRRPATRGRPDPPIGCRTHAGLLTIRRSPRAHPARWQRDLIRACPPHERPLPVLSVTQQPGRNHSGHVHRGGV